MLWFAMTRAPLREEADDQAPEHSQDPQGIGATNSAAIFIKRHIQALMSPVLDCPGHAIGFEPVCCGQSFGWQVGDEPDGFVLASNVLPCQQSGLSSEGKANVLGCNGAALQRAALGNALILLEGAGLGKRRNQRGKNPWAAREPFGRCFAAG